MNKLINLVIPCAGKSTRFFNEGYKTHKAFLKLNKEFTILESILKSFDKKFFKPHVVFTHIQKKEFQNELKQLKDDFPELTIHSIDEHDLGPTYSIANITLPPQEPLLVHYCDFLTKFKVDTLIKNIHEGKIVAPYFRGFHPASLGTTNFAYLIIDSIGEMINLQEKKPFTDNRIEEPASTGIYGFPSFKLFKELADNLFSNKSKWQLKEAYTSLLLNEALAIGRRVICIEVKNFICLGTPRDYEEYLFWENLYSIKYKIPKNPLPNDSHLITAAGKGTRFEKDNYYVPKIFNKLFDNTLIELALKSIPNSDVKILLLEDVYTKANNLIKNSSQLLDIYKVKKSPDGQLISLKKLINFSNPKKSFFVSSADYEFRINHAEFSSFIKEKNPDIVIFTTKWNPVANEEIINYGFTKNSSEGRIINIVEKPDFKIQPDMLKNLLIGTFWFRNKSIIENLPLTKINGEAFIANSINEVIDKLKVYAFPVDYWLSLGTPKELNLAKYWFEYFSYDSNK